MLNFADNRQTGRTTRQMQGAPLGAIFVWVSSQLDYPKEIARKIGREDLVIVSPGEICRHCYGKPISGIVVDHAARLTSSERRYVLYAMGRVGNHD